MQIKIINKEAIYFDDNDTTIDFETFICAVIQNILYEKENLEFDVTTQVQGDEHGYHQTSRPDARRDR